MQGYVGTLMNLPQSVAIAQRCVDSCRLFGIEAKLYPATPKERVGEALAELGLRVGKVDATYSDPQAVVANFLTQFRTWKEIAESGEPGIVFEHDAVLVAELPDLQFQHVMNIGRPSFGSFLRKEVAGVHPLFSKRGGYFPGAHAYVVKPSGARLLLQEARKNGASPCDMFLCRKNFPWLQELYPWVAEAHDSFSTIQRRKGCIAKHRFDTHFKHL